MNTIEVTVVDESAKLTIKHVVEVQQVDISWPSGTCTGPHESLPAGQIVNGLESKKLGDVKCGFTCPLSGFQCEATARVDIKTSVGSTYTEAPWDVNFE